MDDTDLLISQLETKLESVDREVVDVTAEIRESMRYSEKFDLEERLAELEARKEVVSGYLKKGRKRLVKLQTRYKELIVEGRTDTRAGTGGYYSDGGGKRAGSDYYGGGADSGRRGSYGGGTSSGSRQDARSTPYPSPSPTGAPTPSTSSSQSSASQPRSGENESPSWDQREGFGSFGRRGGSGRRRGRPAGRRGAPGSGSGSSSTSSYSTDGSSSASSGTESQSSGRGARQPNDSVGSGGREGRVGSSTGHGSRTREPVSPPAERGATGRTETRTNVPSSSRRGQSDWSAPVPPDRKSVV